VVLGHCACGLVAEEPELQQLIGAVNGVVQRSVSRRYFSLLVFCNRDVGPGGYEWIYTVPQTRVTQDSGPECSLSVINYAECGPTFCIPHQT